MRYMLWRLASDAVRNPLADRVSKVRERIVADEVARMLGGDRWHEWRSRDFGAPNVHDKVAWIEWAHDPRLLEQYPTLGYDRSTAQHERFGAYCMSFRIPSARGARVSRNLDEIVRRTMWRSLDDLVEACPGGTFNVAFTFACSWRAHDPLWSRYAGERGLVRLSDFEWAVRPDGTLVTPADHTYGGIPYTASGNPSHLNMLRYVETSRGPEARSECYSLFSRNAEVVIASFGLLSLGGARLRRFTSIPAPVDYVEARDFGDPDPVDADYSSLELAPAEALPSKASEQVREACRRDRGCVDLEAIAAWVGVPYVLVSAQASKVGVDRLSPDECEEIRRLRDEEEAERLEAERRRAEESERLTLRRMVEEEERRRREDVERRRRERWEAWKARRDESRAERARQAVARARIHGHAEPGAVQDEDIHERPTGRWRPKPDAPRPDPLLASVRAMSREDEEEDDLSRPGPDYPWNDGRDLVHQGRHWRVVHATTPAGRSPSRDYVEWLQDVAPGDWDSILETIRIVADDPMGHMPVSKRFKCFSRPSGYLVCEFKRTGLSGHARVLAFRDTRPGRDGKVERRVVLLHGFSKQTNETPEEELAKADSVRATWLSRR